MGRIWDVIEFSYFGFRVCLNFVQFHLNFVGFSTFGGRTPGMLEFKKSICAFLELGDVRVNFL